MHDVSCSEDEYIQALKASRQRDKLHKCTHFGVHRANFEVIYADKNLTASLCSTGEQKLLLIATIIAQTSTKKSIILLDDVFSHLDHKHRDNLLEYICTSQSQAWVTDTCLVMDDFQIVDLNM